MNGDTLDASFWISHLQLQPHPEGGYYRETYRSIEKINREALPARYPGSRAFSTGIYYLLEEGDFSAFHRIKSDEMWHFYAGGPLEIHMIDGSCYSVVVLGDDARAGQHLQSVVPQGVWFASKPVTTAGFSLVGCTVSPGFDYADFEMGSSSQVFERCPERAASLSFLCKA